jgi:hypothetical protein
VSSSTQSIKDFAAKLRALPRVVGMRVAQQAAPVLTSLVGSTTSASADSFGVPWSPGSDGQRVTLRKSGAMLSNLRYVAIGTRMRLALTTSYAKYQLGRRPVAPKQGEGLPAAYSAALHAVARLVIEGSLR